ncbi:MAG: carboxypeptidase-like regulatory domain-containing protein [Planctomycetota bacterium]
MRVALWSRSYEDVRSGDFEPLREVELAEQPDGTGAFELSAPPGPFVLSVITKANGLASSVLYGSLGAGASLLDLELTVRETTRPLEGKFVGRDLPHPEALFIDALPLRWREVLEDRRSSALSREHVGVRLTPGPDHRFTFDRALAEEWTLRYGAFGRRHGSVGVAADQTAVELRLEAIADLEVRLELEGDVDESSIEVRALQGGDQESASTEGRRARFRTLFEDEPLAVLAWSAECGPTAVSFDSVEDAQGAVIRLTPGAPLSGRVLASDGSPCGDAYVRVTGGPALHPPVVRGSTEVLALADVARARTDPEGRFRYPALPEGAYALEVTPAIVAPRETFDERRTGPREHQLLLTAPAAGALAVEVFDLLSREPIEEFELWMTRRQDDEGRRGWRVDARRGESVELAGGRYMLRVAAEGYGPTELELSVESGQRTARTVLLTPTAAATLQFVDEVGSPLPLLEFQLIGPSGKLVLSRVTGDRVMSGSFWTNDSGVAALTHVPTGWCRVEPRADDVREGEAGRTFEPASIWIPRDRSEPIRCTLAVRSVRAEAPRFAVLTVRGAERYSSGRLETPSSPDELPPVSALPSRMTLEVRRPNGTAFSTSTLQVQGETVRVTTTSSGSESSSEFFTTIGIAPVRLLVPSKLDGITLFVESPNGSASIPFPDSLAPREQPWVLVLE